MTLAEFKAWFSGFTEDIDGAPNEKQWKRVKARVKEIDGVAVTKTVFVDRYGRDLRPYWAYGVAYCAPGRTSISVGSVSYNSAVANLNEDRFDSSTAMLALGKADYATMTKV